MAAFSKDLGIDLGTMFTRLADGTRVVLEEPTIVAIDVAEQTFMMAGTIEDVREKAEKLAKE